MIKKETSYVKQSIVTKYIKEKFIRKIQHIAEQNFKCEHIADQTIECQHIADKNEASQKGNAMKQPILPSL